MHPVHASGTGTDRGADQGTGVGAELLPTTLQQTLGGAVVDAGVVSVGPRRQLDSGTGDRGDTRSGPHQKYLGRLQRACHRHHQFETGDVVRLAHGVPADVGDDGDGAGLQQRAQQIRVDAFHPAGALVVDAVHHSRGARPHPVAYHRARPAFGEQGE